jgi:hypothetical protein
MDMLDRDNAAFIQTGVSISLAACGPDRPPSMSRGLGCKVFDDGRRVGVFLKRSQSADLLANIRDTGKVANVFSLPSNHRTLQLKGVDARVMPFDPADGSIIDAHVDDFVRELLALGLSESVVRLLFTYAPDDLVTVVYSPCAAFSQTPGPKAGEPLGKAP